MNQQQEARRAAAQAFYQALEQLQQSLEAADSAAATDPAAAIPLPADASLPLEANLNAWEDAIADIDQFMQNLSAPDS